MQKNNRTIFVSGNFDILHPGHIRLLKFAKECGDKLVVAVNSDTKMAGKSRVEEQHRLEMVRSLECVDEAFLTSRSTVDIVTDIKPHAVVKGKEFECKHNPEQDILDSNGGQLIFGSGEFESNAENFIRRQPMLGSNFDFREAKSFAKRHGITPVMVKDVFSKFSQLKVAVFGEVIVDRYIQGTAVGLSQEDPTIVMTPDRTDTFLGGAAITAGHIKSIGAKKVTLFSVLGQDKQAKYCHEKIADYQIVSEFVTDLSRPTPLKTRYRAGSKTLLRVNELRQHKISKALQNELLNRLETIIDDLDLLVFSDFNYGVLPQTLVERICQLCEKNNITMVADSQTSSQVGDISRYRNMTLITPTEKEVRVALNNTDDGLPILAQKLCDIAQPKNLVVTLGSEGIFIHVPANETQWENDKLPAIHRNAMDPAGAGDCFLATSSMALCCGASPWMAFYLANVAAACQVDTVGNTPLHSNMLLDSVMTSFK
jgi:rfaE bifunctional protein kinase chain/domain